MTYTYLYLPIVASIIVSDVADELALALAHPDHASDAGIAAMLGGPALYLPGVGAFKWVSNDRRWPPLSHLAGLALLAALALPAFSHLLSALAMVSLTSGIVVLVAAREHVSLRSHTHGVPAAAR